MQDLDIVAYRSCIFFIRKSFFMFETMAELINEVSLSYLLQALMSLPYVSKIFLVEHLCLWASVSKSEYRIW
jgi:hypothetical protein